MDKAKSLLENEKVKPVRGQTPVELTYDKERGPIEEKSRKLFFS